jgi:hypothetical protein
MVVLMSAALLGAVLGATLNWQADALTFALGIPFGGSLFAIAAAMLLFVTRSRDVTDRGSNHLPPPGVVWC